MQVNAKNKYIQPTIDTLKPKNHEALMTCWHNMHKTCREELLPILMNIKNGSLEQGTFPNLLEIA